MSAASNTVPCPFCGRESWSPVFEYTEAPPGEVRYAFSSGGEYRRTVSVCEGCGHMVSRHQMEEGSLYSGDYVNATYGDDAGMVRTFERIIGLDPARSDNVGRVARVVEFAAKYGIASGGASPTVLDVGSGLCVFLHGMKSAGWAGTALDPDPRAAAHARDRVGVEAVCADFRTATELGRYDVITFNKVLEHVPDPISMLAQCLPFVGPGGYVYVELPHGEVAALHGADREEFFIDHHHIFSMASLALLAVRAGFRIVEMERLQEPSTKYTLRAFLRPAASG